jgi:glycosyltransferase involved in cell wall biosynthesis
VPPLKIAVISDVIYPWVKGGAERRYYEIYRRLAKRHEIHYFTMQYPGMKKQFKFEGMKIHAICKAPTTLYVDGRRKITPAIKFAIFLLFKLMGYHFDAIDSNEFPHLPNLIVRLYRFLHHRTSFVITWHEFWSPGYWQDYLGVFKGLLGFAMQILSLKSTKRIVAVSDHTCDYITRTRILPSGNLHVIWNGIDTGLIEKAKKVREPVANTIVFAGRLIPEKRVDLVIEVVKRISTQNPDVQLQIIGDGPERNRLENLAQGIRVEFLGWLEDHLEVLRKIASASVYISMSEREGFNISALEACELGIPTFARIICFEHKNLHKIKPDKLNLLLEYLPKIPIFNEEVSELYSWDNIAYKMEKILKA